MLADTDNCLLDIGCAEGEFLRRAINSHLFSTLCGADIDAKALAKAKSEVEPRFSDQREYEYFTTSDKRTA